MSDNYSELFIHQFIQTLAQVSAVIVSGSLAVPVYNYYIRNFNTNTNNANFNNTYVNEDIEDIEDIDDNDDDTILINETSSTDVNGGYDADTDMDGNNNQEFIDH